MNRVAPYTRSMQVCPGCGEENPDKFRLCGFCGTPLAPALPPQEVRKTVTIVFSDLKGSTNLGEALDSESLREVMSRYFDEMRTELERHGGTIEKFIGDAVMAVFGLPTLHEDDALRAVRAAAGMKRALERLNDELERVWGVRLTNRTGVNTGEVVAGDPTAGQRLVTGDAVNVAARLEQAAPANDVLLGELTYQLVKDAVEVEAVEPLELKGKAERVPAYRLLTVREHGEGWSRRRDAPLVGRERELRALLQSFDAAVAERACRLATVVGDAGVGKSRLNEEFLASIGGRARVLSGRCLSYGEGITFWPLVEVVRQAASIREDDTPDVARAKLVALAGLEGDDVVERVASAVGLSPEAFPIEELFWGARKLLESLARTQPLVVLFDDIHWAEPTFLDLIEHLLEAVQDAPLLLLCPARHDLLEQRPEWAVRERATRIVLEPLSGDDTARIVEGLLGDASAAEDVRARIVEAAEGNPLFVEQLLSMLIDNGHLRLEEGRWVAAAGLAGVVVPPSIHALLAARLDRLGQEERAVVEPASVIGLVFPQAAVAELAPEAVRSGVPAHLGSLVRKRFLRPEPRSPEEERFRFDHVLIREAAYGGLLKRARATLHERFVDWADRVNRERGRETEYEEILGYHLEQAHRYLSELGPLDDHGRELGARAAARLASAARRAFARGDMPAAANLFRRAVALMPADAPERLALLPALADALIYTGEYAGANAAIDEVLARDGEAGAGGTVARARLSRLTVRLHTGEAESWSDEAAHEAARAVRVFEQLDDQTGLARAWQLLGYAHGNACRFGEMASAFERALEHARAAGDAKLQTRGSTEYAFALAYGPTPAPDAVRRCREIADQVAADRQAQALVLSSLALLEAMQKQFDDARAHARQARALLEELGLRVAAASIAMDAGRVELLAGDPVAAERELRRGYDELERVGETFFRSTLACFLAGALYELGRPDEADALTRTAEQLAADDDVATQALWRSVRAKLETDGRRHDGAVALAREAVELLARTDVTALQAQALLDEAEVLRAAGDAPGSVAAAERATGLAAAKGVLPLVERAVALVADLSQAPLVSG